MRLIISLLLPFVLLSCRDDKNIPDVSNIQTELSTQRFDEELFSLDTSKLVVQLDSLLGRYPSFGENFLTTILNTDPKWSPDSAASYIMGFLSAYRNIFDTSQLLYSDFSLYEKK